MCAMLCALILVISMTLSVQGDRWSKQELRESQEQDKDVQQILHSREKSDIQPSWEIIAPFSDTVGQPLRVRRSSLSPVEELGRQLHHKAASITKISLCYQFTSASLLPTAQ